MGFVVVDRSDTENPAIEAPAGEAAVVEKVAEIEEINRPEEENVAPQCVRVARKEVMSGCSMKKTTQTRPSANCSEQLMI
jgi:hypothetical protein